MQDLPGKANDLEWGGGGKLWQPWLFLEFWFPQDRVIMHCLQRMIFLFQTKCKKSSYVRSPDSTISTGEQWKKIPSKLTALSYFEEAFLSPWQWWARFGWRVKGLLPVSCFSLCHWVLTFEIPLHAFVYVWQVMLAFGWRRHQAIRSCFELTLYFWKCLADVAHIRKGRWWRQSSCTMRQSLLWPLPVMRRRWPTRPN